MPGILFDKGNTSGRLLSAQYFPASTPESPIFNSNEYRYKIWMLFERGPDSDNSPLVRLVTQHKNGGDKTAVSIRLEAGKITARLASYDDARYYDFATLDTLAINELTEIAVIFNYAGTYGDNGNLKIYINGSEVAVNASGFYTSTTIINQTVQVDLGGGDSTVDVAKDIFISDLAINPYQVTGSPTPDNFNSYYGIWRANFTRDSDLKLLCTRDNGGGDAALTIINTGASWTDADGLPSDSGSVGIIIPGNGNNTRIQGMVTENNQPVSRRVFAITEALLEVSGTSETKHAVLDSTFSNATTGAYTLDTSPYEGEVLVLAMDNYGAIWQPDTAYQVGDIIRPSSFQGYVYTCTVAGSSDSTEPQWWFDVDNDQSVGNAQFKAKPYTRPLAHGPLTPEIIIA